MFTTAEWLNFCRDMFSNKIIWKNYFRCTWRLCILGRWGTWRNKWQQSCGGSNCWQTPSDVWCRTIFARRLTEINSFSFKSNLLREIYKHFEISFGTRTTKSDLQKITEMVVECSCAVWKIVARDARRRKTTLNRSVYTLPIITHFFSAGSPWIHCPSGKSPA